MSSKKKEEIEIRAILRSDSKNEKDVKAYEAFVEMSKYFKALKPTPLIKMLIVMARDHWFYPIILKKLIEDKKE